MRPGCQPRTACVVQHCLPPGLPPWPLADAGAFTDDKREWDCGGGAACRVCESGWMGVILDGCCSGPGSRGPRRNQKQRIDRDQQRVSASCRRLPSRAAASTGGRLTRCRTTGPGRRPGWCWGSWAPAGRRAAAPAGWAGAGAGAGRSEQGWGTRMAAGARHAHSSAVHKKIRCSHLVNHVDGRAADVQGPRHHVGGGARGVGHGVGTGILGKLQGQRDRGWVQRS